MTVISNDDNSNSLQNFILFFKSLPLTDLPQSVIPKMVPQAFGKSRLKPLFDISSYLLIVTERSILHVKELGKTRKHYGGSLE